MATRKCKDCGNQVSTRAKQCPNCGAPVKKKTGCLGVIGLPFHVGLKQVTRENDDILLPARMRQSTLDSVYDD